MALSVTTCISLFLCFSPAFTTVNVDTEVNDFHSPFSEDANESTNLHHKVFTKEELAKYDGSNPDLPIYVAVKGVVFDVSTSKKFYGAGGNYNAFAGKDASRGIAKWSVAKEDLNDDLDNLTTDQLTLLDNAFKKIYSDKYPTVGYLEGHEPRSGDNLTFKPKPKHGEL